MQALTKNLSNTSSGEQDNKISTVNDGASNLKSNKSGTTKDTLSPGGIGGSPLT